MPVVHPQKGKLEKKLNTNYEQIVGVDEVGRGCLAGPVCAAAAILDYDKLSALDDGELKLIRDSKTLSSKQRQKIIPVLDDICIHYEVAIADVDEIDDVNILNATFIAIKRAVSQLPLKKNHIVLVDGNKEIPDYKGDQKTIIKGDSIAFAIAAASIIAKEYRDQLMCKYAEEFPGYFFQNHVGYGTKAHLEALEKLGPTIIHRKSFAPVRRLL